MKNTDQTAETAISKQILDLVGDTKLTYPDDFPEDFQFSDYEKEIAPMVDRMMEVAKEEKKENEQYKKWFKTDPVTNVLSEENYKRRIGEVFKLVYDVLSKSFGPFGANTIISSGPSQHVTKDGFTIFKNMYFSCADNPMDMAFSNMIRDVCTRLNYSVGDGTTTATIATYSIYNSYMKRADELRKLDVRSKRVIDIFNSLKDKVIDKLNEKVVPIQSTDNDVLANNIHDVVYISSNGDEQIAEDIANVYRELGSPALTIDTAPDGKTKIVLDTGFKYLLGLADPIYANADSSKMELLNADVIIFQTKINNFIYEEIIKPLRAECTARGRKLIVCAAVYDETLMKRTISKDVYEEWNKTKDFSVIYTAYSCVNGADKKSLSDFAMFCNTRVLDWDDVKYIKKQITEEHHTVGEIFNIDDRELIPIKKTLYKAYSTDRAGRSLFIGGEYDDKGLEEKYAKSGLVVDKLIDDHYNLGYVGECVLGMKESIFHELYYDEDLYKKQVEEAKNDLETAIDKYSKLAAFNTEISSAQKRYYALGLKLATYYVGGDTELAKTTARDVLDDCVKAASSAFQYGVVHGCGVDVLSILWKILNEDNLKEDEKLITDIIFEGFIDVYRTILGNGFDDVVVYDNTKLDSIYGHEIISEDDEASSKTDKSIYAIAKNLLSGDSEIFNIVLKRYGRVSLFDVTIFISILDEMVFDVTTCEFTNMVVNSVRTDIEVLKATSDLISLLITGNQMIVTDALNQRG